MPSIREWKSDEKDPSQLCTINIGTIHMNCYQALGLRFCNPDQHLWKSMCMDRVLCANQISPSISLHRVAIRTNGESRTALIRAISENAVVIEAVHVKMARSGHTPLIVAMMYWSASTFTKPSCRRHAPPEPIQWL